MDVKTRFLGIDFGDKRIGIAVSDEDKIFSFSRDFLTNNNELYIKLLKIIKEENVSKIVIGYPLNFKSEQTIQTTKVIAFRNKLDEFLNKNFLPLELVFFDERFTSKIAQCRLIDSGCNKKARRNKGLVDSISAQIILQDYIDKNKNLLIN